MSVITPVPWRVIRRLVSAIMSLGYCSLSLLVASLNAGADGLETEAAAAFWMSAATLTIATILSYNFTRMTVSLIRLRRIEHELARRLEEGRL